MCSDPKERAMQYLRNVSRIAVAVAR
ncbi:carboxypeptidase regulator, partial [Burkholderia multivorans]